MKRMCQRKVFRDTLDIGALERHDYKSAYNSNDLNNVKR